MLTISEDLCIGCGICEDSCPFGVMEVHDGLAVAQDGCTLCGACVKSCAVGAISIELAQSSSVQKEEWSGVWVFCESRKGRLAEVSLELLTMGRKLADSRGSALGAVLLGEDLTEVPARLIGHGADDVYLLDDPIFADFNEDVYTVVVEALIREYRPEIVLAGATAIGRSFIPGVATLLNAGLTADCTQLEIREEDGVLLQTRPAFGGNIMATIVCEESRPQMATVRPKVMSIAAFDPERSGNVYSLGKDYCPERNRIRVLKSVASENEHVNIQEADILVAGGRGLGSAKGFELVQQLAVAMGGSVSASRAVVDAGWIAYPHQVGQTGKTVAPKVYIACGISGAVQHVAGMQSAETIVAINRDKNAAIFDIADYGLVGDLFEIIPKLIRKIEERRTK
ncbi:MAG: electron transfer flavoprotein subunit alpha [Deltaproteobacteria bacterium]|nr:MAG: electron transfer flavoprotein subunit alpha [Deltaproteobacteria bacterium]